MWNQISRKSSFSYKHLYVRLPCADKKVGKRKHAPYSTLFWYLACCKRYIFHIFNDFFFIFHFVMFYICNMHTDWYIFVETMFSALFLINEVSYWGQNLLLPDFTQSDFSVSANSFIIVEITLIIMFLL